MDNFEKNLIMSTFHAKFSPFEQDFYVQSIGCEDFQYVQPITFFRKQPYFTLHYILRGAGTIYFRGNTYSAQKGDFFVLPTHENIKYLPNKNDPWQYFWFDFNGTLAQNFFNALYKDTPIIRGISQESCYTLFHKLFSDAQTNGWVKYYTVLSCFYGILAELSDTEMKPAKISFVDTVKNFMALNYHSADFNIDTLWKMVHVSHSYLCKIFQREAGVTIKQHLTSLRMSEAARLLKNTTFNVKEIAFQVGFSDDINFMKAFKKYHNMTPSEYRNT